MIQHALAIVNLDTNADSHDALDSGAAVLYHAFSSSEYGNANHTKDLLMLIETVIADNGVRIFPGDTCLWGDFEVEVLSISDWDADADDEGRPIGYPPRVKILFHDGMTDDIDMYMPSSWEEINHCEELIWLRDATVGEGMGI
jgi:hypothetical protein